MNLTRYRALISATTKEEADKILDVLLTKRIVAGGMITHGPSRYWWKGEIAEMEYYNISTFIGEKGKEALIAEVRTISTDEVPMIALFPMDGNEDFLEWIDGSIIK